MKTTTPATLTNAWTRDAPPGTPFVPSLDVHGLRRTGRFASYGAADTWYPSWGAVDRLYSPFTDGTVFGVYCNSIDAKGPGGVALTGQAIKSGADPLDLHITDAATHPGPAAPYLGRYPSACLMHDGTWYYGTYCLDETGAGLNFDVLEPFVGFRTSRDNGATWDDGPHSPRSPLFGETALNGEAVRMGAPHFVDFGKNMHHSPDGYAYLVGHGSRAGSGRLSWISGDEITLGRVRPTPTAINDPDAWEWAAGRRADGAERWVPDLGDAVPIASWPGHMGCVTATYLPQRRRYLMCVTDGWPTIKQMTSYVLESESLFGPWRMVAYMDAFGEQGYFLNFPSRFVSPAEDTLWLCYSANFTNQYLGTVWAADPPGSRYAMCLEELELMT